MRVPQNSGGPSFEAFAFKESSHGASSRQPDRDTMRAMNSSQARSQKLKAIILSDDEEPEEVNIVAGNIRKTISIQSSASSPGTGWLSSRDPSSIGESARMSNVQRALLERKNRGKEPRKEKKRDKSSKRKGGGGAKGDGSDDDDDEESNDETYMLREAPEHIKKMMVLQKERKAAASSSRALRLAQRGANSGKSGGVIDLASDEESVKSDGDSESDDSGNSSGESSVRGGGDDDDDDDDDVDPGGWREEAGKGELQVEAKKILRTCETISTSLRQSLKSWRGTAEASLGSPVAGHRSSSSSSSSSSSGREESADCINLIAISGVDDTTRGSILRDEDMKQMCPDLILKPYQLVGVNWIKLLHENKINGVLADDMGLGKTIQTISFLGWLSASKIAAEAASGSSHRRRPHLIVVPASTLANWENEFHRFCPSFHIVTYHGSQTERSELRHQMREELEDGSIDVVLSTYTIFERESGKDDRKFLYKQHFDYLILDEAHCIKNADSSRYTKLSALRSRHRLLLSGTPVQNDVGELLALLSFLMPKTFNRRDCNLLLEAFGWGEANKTKSGKASSGAFSLSQLRGMLAPFVLRRLKMDVLDQLVAKETYVRKVAMTAAQKKVYEDILLAHAARREKTKLQMASEAEAEALLDCKGKSKAKKRSKRAAKIIDDDDEDEDGNEKDNKGSLIIDEASIVDLCSPDKKRVKAEDDVIVVMDDGDEQDRSSAVGLSGAIASSAVDLTEAGETEVCVVDEVLRQLTATEAKNLFTALRKAANHPLLLRIRYQDEDVMDRIAQVALSHSHFGDQCDFKRIREELDSFSDFDLHQLCLEYPDYLGELQVPEEALFDSPKMVLLQSMLPQLAEQGHRMLIFSQWTRLLDLLEVLLNHMNMNFLRLDGSTPVKTRQALIDKFNAAAKASEGGGSGGGGGGDRSRVTPIPVFLLSTKAGGLGINLTSADTVIMHDLDFNPENDKQAEDRCHRIGQTKAVKVYKLVTEDTVDDDIFMMGERKSKLSAAVLSDDRSGSKAGAGAGAGAKGGDGTDDLDIGSIGRILQKALLKVSK